MRGLRTLRWCASFEPITTDLIAVGDRSYIERIWLLWERSLTANCRAGPPTQMSASRA